MWRVMNRKLVDIASHGPRRRWVAVGSMAAMTVVCCALSGVARAGDDALPSGAEVLDKYIEATGGKAAYAKLHNRVTQVTIDFNISDVTAEMTIYEAAPGKRYTLVESESIGTLETGTDGTTYWHRSAERPVKIQEGAAKAASQRESLFLMDLHWRKLFDKVKCVGTEKIQGKQCYKVVLTGTDGVQEIRHFDKENGLQLKRTSVYGSGGNRGVAWERYFDDYREVDGVLIPHLVRILLSGEERTMVVNSVKHNVDLSSDRFDLPTDVQEELKKPKKPEELEKTGKPENTENTEKTEKTEKTEDKSPVKEPKEKAPGEEGTKKPR